MIALLGSLLGFLGAFAPKVLEIFTDRRDKAHEIEVLRLQIEREKAGYSAKLDEIQAAGDAMEAQSLYKTYSTGITWVDALNGTVRPVLAYAFFVLYAIVKALYVYRDLPWDVWTDEDTAIFAGIVSFYFGQRSLRKK